MATAGNATDFGDATAYSKLFYWRYRSETRGVFTGGGDPSNVAITIEFVNFATTGNGH